ncbi:MAG: hypothetical protein FWF03_04530, partial [Defluviitaleaceae bacterium]|nr:hypothetical protein [Defluviitaleaceae bacterium]
NQTRLKIEKGLVGKSNCSNMPLMFFRCRKCKHEFKNLHDAKNCEAAHPQPVSIRNVSYTVKNWPYQVEVTFNDGSKRLYSADEC